MVTRAQTFAGAVLPLSDAALPPAFSSVDSARLALCLHRLLAELDDVEQISVDIFLPNGTPLLSFADVPFERSSGAVLIACSRHFVEQFPPDVDFVVRRRHRTGRESVEKYTVFHRVG